MTNLRVRSQYSLLESIITIDEVMNIADKNVAICDKNMFGTIELYKLATKVGKTPIVCCEIKLHLGVAFDKKATLKSVIFIAKTEKGYKNLINLLSQAYLKGFSKAPSVNLDIVKSLKKDLICVNPTDTGFANDSEGQKALYNMFGDDFYIGLTNYGANNGINEDIEFCRKTGIKGIFANIVKYLKPEDRKYQAMLNSIETSKMQIDDLDYSAKTDDEIESLIPDYNVRDNMEELISKCNVKITLGEATPPNFKFVKEYAQAEGLDYDNDADYFVHKCREGLEERLKLIPQEQHEKYRQRLEYEMDIINSMKFPGYMLIVWDFMRQAREMGVAVGPGRGSAAGSLVAYALKITNINPIPYNLLFERFLNPERISMPDIDIDFHQGRRGEVIDYVTKTYGRNNVAQVITFGKLGAKGVLKDVGRTLGMSFAEANVLSGYIPDEPGITLSKAMENNPDLQRAESNNPELFDYAKRLEGLNRNTGMHAAGVVISDNEMWNKSPIYRADKDDNNVVTQYNLDHLEDVDLIKFDFLGLKTLDVIDNAVKAVKKNSNLNIDIDNIDLQDKKVLELIQTGKTVGMFQIESSGMQDLCKRIKPDSFEDLIALIALYRPGPMESGMLDSFVARKRGEEEISYFYPEMEKVLKPILSPTYGVIVYQEQVMQIVQTIGGFSLGEADMIRRAMGKKKIAEMEKAKQQFAEGAVRKGFKAEEAKDLFSKIEKFAGYGFNKSHSAAYAMISFQTAYLKTYFPEEFMASLLTLNSDDSDKISIIANEAKEMGLKLILPHINKSVSEFQGKKGHILYGLNAIKGIGHAVINSILTAREEGPFKDMQDFLRRIDGSKVNKTAIEALAASGAFDSLKINRATVFNSSEYLVKVASKYKTARDAMENSLFNDGEDFIEINLNMPSISDWSKEEILEHEMKVLSTWISGHPLDDYKDIIAKMKKSTYAELAASIDEGDSQKGQAVIIAKIDKLDKRMGKKGYFGIISCTDLSSSFSGITFEKSVKFLEDRENTSEPVAMLVELDKSDKYPRTTIKKIVPLREANSLSTENRKKGGYTSKSKNKKENQGQQQVFIDMRTMSKENIDFLVEKAPLMKGKTRIVVIDKKGVARPRGTYVNDEFVKLVEKMS